MKLSLDYCKQNLSLLGLQVSVKHWRVISHGFNNVCVYIESECGQQLLIKEFKDKLNFKCIKIEHALLQKNIVPAILAVNESHSLVAYQYIPHHKYQETLHIQRLVEKLKALHSSKIVDAYTIQLEELTYSFNHLRTFSKFEAFIKQCLQEVKQYPLELGFCHNDLVIENILFDSADTWIIDFEYSGINDINFDLAAVSQSLSFDLEKKKQLLINYFSVSEISKSQLNKLNLYQDIYNLVCFFWYTERGLKKQADALLPYLKQTIN